jgi:hypothetical protein
MLVGPAEEGFESLFRDNSRVHRIGYTQAYRSTWRQRMCFACRAIEKGLAGSDRSRRGGLPVVASRIYGITDAVVEGETGLCTRLEM